MMLNYMMLLRLTDGSLTHNEGIGGRFNAANPPLAI